MFNKLIFFSIFLIFKNLFSQDLTGKELLEKAINFHDPMNNWNDFQDRINRGGFVSAHWDGTSETEDEIKKLTKATIRCIPINSKKESGTCVLTSKSSSQRVIFAKSY